MSAADLGSGAGGAAVRQASRPGPGHQPELARNPGAPVLSWLRLLRSELQLIFLRRRNLALLAVLAGIPLLIGFALRLQDRSGGGGGSGPAFLSQVTGNGVFLALAALTVLLILVLPLAVAVVAGDSIAGEAGLGTLRYLLTVPAGRTRLLAIKFAAVVIFGLAVSTLTEHAIAAMAAILVIVVGSEVADSVSQFAVIHPLLPTHFWLSFDTLLRTPIDWAGLSHGLVSFGVYVVIFCSIAWARFTTADVTS